MVISLKCHRLTLKQVTISSGLFSDIAVYGFIILAVESLSCACQGDHKYNLHLPFPLSPNFVQHTQSRESGKSGAKQKHK